MTDRYTKVLLTMMCLCLIWLGVKDTPLEPVVSAQNQGGDTAVPDWTDTALGLGFPDPNLALREPSVIDSTQVSAYVCYSRLHPKQVNTAYGRYGHLLLGFTGGPNCTGGFSGWANMYSVGAISSNTDPNYLYSEAGLLAYAEMTQRAALSGQQVTYYSCHGYTAGSACISYLTFKGLPPGV